MNRRMLALTMVALAQVWAIAGCGGDDEITPTPNPPDEPQVTAEKVGEPTWKPADIHLFTTVRNGNEGFSELIKQLLPPPNHKYLQGFGIMPGEGHTSGHDREIGDNLAKLGLKESTRFTVAEVTDPNSVNLFWMNVPAEGSATGSSPDFESGPIISHDLFPIDVEMSMVNNGVPHPKIKSAFPVPRLDGAPFEPPFQVDGHSHFPLFFRAWLEPSIAEGEHLWEVKLTDSKGNGWVLHAEFTAAP